MSTRDDPLVQQASAPDRVFYATGVLLDAQDFEAEQSYHRGRLARALAYTQGAGTAAGLRVRWDAATAKREERVSVEPGLAIDRLGRQVEVPRTACIRLGRWFDAQTDTVLAESWRESVTFTPDVVTPHDGQPPDIVAGTDPVTMQGVVVDVFLRFVSCERGKTPAFATGPFDALDAVQPSRVRDGYELTLVGRRVGLPVPTRPWSALDPGAEPVARRRKLEDLLFGAWKEGGTQWTEDGLAPLPEHAGGVDPSAIFLARMVLPATRAGTARPARVGGQDVRVDNHSRLFVYTAGALGRALGAL